MFNVPDCPSVRMHWASVCKALVSSGWSHTPPARFKANTSIRHVTNVPASLVGGAPINPWSKEPSRRCETCVARPSRMDSLNPTALSSRVTVVLAWSPILRLVLLISLVALFILDPMQTRSTVSQVVLAPTIMSCATCERLNYWDAVARDSRWMLESVLRASLGGPSIECAPSGAMRQGMPGVCQPQRPFRRLTLAVGRIMGRCSQPHKKTPYFRGLSAYLAEREGFEPSIRLLTLYSLSRGAPSATRASLRVFSRITAEPARILTGVFKVKRLLKNQCSPGSSGTLPDSCSPLIR